MNIKGLTILFASLLAVTPALAHEGGDAHGKGVVSSVDAVNHKVNISHDPISTLGWPAMKMDFVVSHSVDLTAVKPGATVEFTLEKNKAGAFEIQSIEPVSTKK
ncbi:MAG: copper-binding protein [Rhodospirillaceae bacterium]|nr:copper-binding protein [Rhodospirillaceae bacterium]